MSVESTELIHILELVKFRPEPRRLVLTNFPQRNCVFLELKINESISDLMMKNKSDVGIRPFVFTRLRADRFVELTKPVSLYSFGIAQFLNKPSGIRSDLSAFLVENRLLIFFMLIGYLVPLFAVCIFSLRRLNVHRSIRPLRIAPRLLSLPQNRMRVISPKLARIFVFYSLFLFILRITLTNLIKTNAIILDTSQFIDSRQRLFDSTKTMMICGNPLEKTLGSKKSTTENSFTFKLFSQKMRDDRLIEVCFSKKGFKRMQEKSNKEGLTSLFFFMSSAFNMYYLSLFSNRKGPLFIFMGREGYREEGVTLTIRRNLEWSLKQKAIRR